MEDRGIVMVSITPSMRRVLFSYKVQGILISVSIKEQSKIPSAEHLIGFLKLHPFDWVLSKLHQRTIQFSSHIWANSDHN